MQLSHRDHRADDSLARAFWGIVALVTVGVALALYAPWTWLGVVALFALGGLGGLYVVHSGRTTSAYLDDLRSVRRGGDVSGWVRYEVGRQVPLDRPVGLPTQRSPHTRPPAGPTETLAPSRNPRS